MPETQKVRDKLLVIVAPGQGAQTPGMFSSWLSDETFRSVVDEAQRTTGIDLEYLGTRADADEIRETKNAQPLLVTSALGSFKMLSSRIELPDSTLVAGHSVGEIVSLAISNVLSFADAFRLVARRAESMHVATGLAHTSMAAVLGGERNEVLSHLRSMHLVAANENGAGQIVAAGSADDIARLLQEPPTGARVRALSVAGAFHTDYMKPAQGPVLNLVSTLEVSEPNFRVISNKEGAIVDSGRDLVDRIVSQIAAPVRWDLCMQTMQHEGVTGLLELFPGGTLTGIAKRALTDIETFSVTGPETIDDAVEFAQRHSLGQS